jgi:hypothetical protein
LTVDGSRLTVLRAAIFTVNRQPSTVNRVHMHVGVVLFELHIPYAQSLKEKRSVVKSLREQLVHRFAVSAAEVAHQDLHQRARIGLCFVTSDPLGAGRTFESLRNFVESHSDAPITGWIEEVVDFDAEMAL